MASEPLDVLVVGGGVTGVGAALDAASRGLRVGIVEKGDWAIGTSSRSSKMIHGGLRYLATGDVAIVRESLRERAALQRNAAHLVRPLSMVLPVYGGRTIPFQRVKIGAGLLAYDLLGAARAGSRHEWLALSELLALASGIDPVSKAGGGKLRGGHRYHDAQADDARLVMSVLRTAVAHGAMASNGCEVVRLLEDGGRVRGAVVMGEAVAGIAGEVDGRLEIEAQVVVNAGGVWAARVLEGSDQPARFGLLPSKGIHVMVRRDRVGLETGMAFFEQTGNSNVFVEPWQDDLAIVGTTDAPHEGELDEPTATDAEIDWLLGKVNQFLRAPLHHDDVIAAWAGLRPLVTDAPDADRSQDSPSKDVSRRHLLDDAPGVVTMTGGKLTAYRAMAEEAIDAAVAQLGRDVPRSITQSLPLDGCRALPGASDIGALAEALGSDRRTARHLLRRHGSNVQHLVAMVEADRDLLEPLHPERPYIAAEVAWAAQHEQPRGVADVLERRTRLSMEVADPRAAEGLVREVLHEHATSPEATVAG